MFSAALCRGLIEADGRGDTRVARAGFPRLYAAASLKQSVRAYVRALLSMFSAALCRGLIEAILHAWSQMEILHRFPRLYAAASLKRPSRRAPTSRGRSFPRLYAAASLKRLERRPCDRGSRLFSAALCRGLIEARGCGCGSASERERFPRLYAAASLKPDGTTITSAAGTLVFRGSMPRPH